MKHPADPWLVQTFANTTNIAMWKNVDGSYLHASTCLRCFVGHTHTQTHTVSRTRRRSYLQSFQQPEVLKGSSLHHTDLVVLQMTTHTHTEQKREKHNLHSLVKLHKPAWQRQEEPRAIRSEDLHEKEQRTCSRSFKVFI